MSLKIVALTGPKGSGKDTVGQMIKEMYPSFNAKTIAFADPIKTEIQHLFDLDPENNDQYDLFKRTSLTYQLKDYLSHSVDARHLVREIGMLMRRYDEKQFTQYVVNEIRYRPTDLWVVTDLRFDNEYSILKGLGAKIIKIIRPQYQYDGHITERAFDDHLVDKILMNDNDIDYLKQRVQYIMNDITKEWQ
jgi:hypothetical protein